MTFVTVNPSKPWEDNYHVSECDYSSSVRDVNTGHVAVEGEQLKCMQNISNLIYEITWLNDWGYIEQLAVFYVIQVSAHRKNSKSFASCFLEITTHLSMRSTYLLTVFPFFAFVLLLVKSEECRISIEFWLYKTISSAINSIVRPILPWYSWLCMTCISIFVDQHLWIKFWFTMSNNGASKPLLVSMLDLKLLM